MLKSVLFTAIGVATLSSSLMACEGETLKPFEDTSAYRQRIKTARDCSFSHSYLVSGGGLKAVYTISAGAVRDLGNGRIAQRHTESGMCSVEENLLFVDCGAAEVIAIEGTTPKREWKIAGLIELRVKDIQKPVGPIGLNSKSTVSELSEVADLNGYSYTRDPNSLIAHLKRRDRFDPYCGCKLYYPDLAGASQ